MKVVVIGTFLPDSLLSPASVYKFGRVNPVPDMTKRKKVSKLTTRESWPPTSKSILNSSSTRSTTSSKNLAYALYRHRASACGNEVRHIFFTLFSPKKPIFVGFLFYFSCFNCSFKWSYICSTAK